jgi:hypothetical protein
MPSPTGEGGFRFLSFQEVVAATGQQFSAWFLVLLFW